MKVREVQIMGNASLRNLALISSMPIALFTFRLLSCVSISLKEGRLNSVFSDFFSLILRFSFMLLKSF